MQQVRLLSFTLVVTASSFGLHVVFSLLWQGRPLLAGVAVGLAEPLETSREALLAVLDAAGAVRADERHEPSVVLCARAERASVASFPRAAWLHPAWLLDSAAAAQELPRDEYGSIVVEEEREEVEEEEGSASLQLSD
jgi:hypothetical protein